MIITEKVKIKIASKNIKHFKELNYDVKYGDLIDVPINHLSTGCGVLITIKCDVCGKISEQSYYEYNKYTSNQGFYSCQKCKSIKRKKTMLEKYGCEHALQNKNIKNKVKETMLKKYGVEYSAYSEEINEKKKQTMIKKYGKDFLFQIDDFIKKSKIEKKKKYGSYNNYEKIKRTKKERHNNENFNNREKSKQTNIEKYGVKNVSQIVEIKKKKEDTCYINNGVKYPQQSKLISQQTKNTNIQKLGVPFPMMSEITKDKAFKTNVKNNRWVSYEERSDFYNYSLLICKHTLKNKRKLLDNWDGCDYYTGESIFENFNLKSNDRNYPTIDHKISIKYGFDNNISVEEISSINNLCITTRSNNSSKGEKIETEFNI